MFWQKPLILFGILAAVGNTAPFTPLRENLTAPENVTTSLFKRVIDDPNDEHLVFRADARTPDQIKKAGGFKSKANFNRVAGDVSLFNHCNGVAKGFQSKDNDGYVSTSVEFHVCKSWVEEKLGGKGVIYQIATFGNLIDCQATLKQYNPAHEEIELAALDGIPFEQIVGWYDQFTIVREKIDTAVFTENPQFNKAKYNKKGDAGAQFQLAGFPKNHAAWKEVPWNAYTACTDKSIKPKPSRRAIDIFARGRKNEARKTKTTKSKPKPQPEHTPTTPKPKPTKPKPRPTTPKPTKPKTCTAAQEKAGKCKTACTAAQKKAGKCNDETKGTCGPIKTNKQFYDEYVKLLKAGKAPKSGATPARGGKKTNAGKKTVGA